MLFNSRYDEFDPGNRSRRVLVRKLRTVLAILAAMTAMCIWWGVPSMQGNYQTYRTSGIPTAADKVNAEYWNPLLRDWRSVEAGEYANGCPVIVFMPLRDCLDLSPYKNSLTLTLFGKEFFDGKTTRP